MAEDPLRPSDDLGAPYLAQRQTAAADDLLARARARMAPAEAAPAADAASSELAAKAAATGTAQARFTVPMASATAALAAGGKDLARGVVEAPLQAVGGVSDAVHNAFAAADHLATWISDKFKDATGIDPRLPSTGIDALDNPLQAIAGKKNEVPPASSVSGGLVRDVTRFLTGFVPALRGAQGAGLPALAAGAAAAGASDALTRDPQEQNLADLVAKYPALQNPVTDFLKSDPADNEATARLKKGLESAVGGGLLDGFVRAIGVIRAARRAGVAPAASVDDLSQQRARYGEVGDRDFLILGDPNAPLLHVEPPALADGAAKLASGTRAVAGETPQAMIERIRQWLRPSGERGAADLAAEDAAQVPAGLAELLAQLRGKNPPAKPQTLTAWLVAKGGLKDQSGELRYMGITSRTRPGLVNNKSGMNFDDAARAAWEERFFQETHFADRIDINDFLEALRGDFNGTHPLYNPVDQAHVDRIAELAHLDEVLARHKLDPATMSDGEIAAALRDVVEHPTPRSEADLAREAADMAAAGADLPKELGGGKVFVNFARINSPADIKAVMGDMADRFAAGVDAARRGVQSNAETKKLADELGMSVGDLLSRREGQPFNAEEALSARRLWAASAAKLLEVAKVAAGPNAGAVDQYNFRKMMAVHYAIQAEVVGARTETARALQAWSIPAGGSVEKARAIQELVAGMGGPDFSRAMAQRLALLEADGAGPASLSQFTRKSWAATTMSVVQEAWINALLSNPKTHLVNIASNWVALGQQIYERKAGEVIASMRADGGGVAPGEAAALTYGLVTGMGDAWRLAWKAWKSGETGGALGKIDLPREPAITGDALREAGQDAAARTVDFLGAAIRTPSRALGAEDEFFKGVGYRMEVHAQSLRQATAEGRDGPDLYRRVAELASDPPEHIRLAAADAALYSTFTNETGKFGQALLKLRGDVPATVFVLPFVRTPLNIARYAFERSPVAPLVGQWRDDIAAGGARAELALARMATGTSAMLLAADLADRGVLSGGGPKEAGERQALERQGWQQYSVKIGERWYSYNRLDPLGMTLGFAADFAEMVRRFDIHPDKMDEASEILAAGIATIAKTTVSKTYLQGLAQFIDMVSEPDQHAPQYVTQFLGSFVPAAVAAAGQAVDPTQRETMKMWDGVQARIPLFAAGLVPKRDLWGAAKSSASGLGAAYDAFSPVASKEAKISPIDAELDRLHYGPEGVKKKGSWDGAPVNFRDHPDVYDEYVRLAGNDLPHPAWGLGAKDYLDAVVTGKHAMADAYRILADTEKPEEGGKAQFIQHTLNDYRRLARQAIEADPKFAGFKAELDATKAQLQQKKMPVLN